MLHPKFFGGWLIFGRQAPKILIFNGRDTEHLQRGPVGGMLNNTILAKPMALDVPRVCGSQVEFLLAENRIVMVGVCGVLYRNGWIRTAIGSPLRGGLPTQGADVAAVEHVGYYLHAYLWR